jgi:hypothetical protein
MDMGNYLKKEGIKSTGRLLAKETRAIRIIYCIIDIIIILFNAEHQLFYFGKNVSKQHIF